MRARPKDDIGYESGGWPATDLPAALAAKPVRRREGRGLVKWAAILTTLAASILLYCYYLAVVR